MTVLNTGSCKAPQVSIGVPVYNGEATIRRAIDSLLAQTFTDFELIISDNASTDETEVICRYYAEKDARIKYFRQTENLGAGANFEFVLRRAVGKYFMWAAADDRWSVEFIEVNVLALQSAPTLSASTAPNCFEGEENDLSKHINFSLNGGCAERYLNFLRNIWASQGIFYCLMRTEVIRGYRFPNQTHAGHDWFINLFMLSNGEIHRTKNGILVSGKNGISNRGNPWKSFRNKRIEVVFPLYEFTKYALSLFNHLSLKESIPLYIEIVKINIKSIKSNFRLTIRGILRYFINLKKINKK